MSQSTYAHARRHGRSLCVLLQVRGERTASPSTNFDRQSSHNYDCCTTITKKMAIQQSRAHEPRCDEVRSLQRLAIVLPFARHARTRHTVLDLDARLELLKSESCQALHVCIPFGSQSILLLDICTKLLCHHKALCHD